MRRAGWTAAGVVAGLIVTLVPAGATRAQQLPDEWIDVGATQPTFASLVSTARRAARAEEFWLGYTFALRDGVHVDCDYRDRGMSFGSDDVNLRINVRDGRADDEPCDDDFGIFLKFGRADDEVIEARIWTLDRAERRIDGPVVWAGEMAAAASVAFLRPAALGRPGTVSVAAERDRRRVFSAVAMHDHPDATGVVMAGLDRAQSAEIRESAVFWASQIGGDDGLEAILDMARNDPDDDVRKQSIFWLGQVAGERATADLAEIAEDDPNTEVQQSAVFALSQSDDDEAVDALIGIVRSHDNREVVRSALFWLGQSGDPRALELFEQLIFGRG